VHARVGWYNIGAYKSWGWRLLLVGVGKFGDFYLQVGDYKQGFSSTF